MFNFILSSETFNGLLKRLVSLSGNDKTAVISFVLDESGRLEVFYNSKLDKTDTSSLFHEQIDPIKYEGSGHSSLYLCNLFSVKVPEHTDDNKFPYCEAIEFEFSKTSLDIKFGIHWSKDLKPNITKLNFPLLKEEEDLEIYSSLFSDKFKSYFELDSKDLRKSISLCNFIKSDATSKETIGCLISVLTNVNEDQNDFCIVNTDSNLAIKHSLKTTGKSLEKDIKVVLTPPILNAARNFISDDGAVRISTFRSQMYIEIDKRRMLIPVMRIRYLIEDPVGFFQNDSPLLAILDLKPAVTLSTALVNKTTNPLKKLTLSFVSDGLGTESFSLLTDTDSTENVPCQVKAEAEVNVNGSFFITAAQRILNLSLEGNLYFEESNNRITLTSEDGDMIFIIQGLYEV